MRLVRHRLDVPPERIEAARAELLDRITPERDAPFRWGYLLGVEDGAALGLDAAAILAATLEEEVAGGDYALSFLKASNGQPPPAAEGVHYDGFHLDTHPAITAERGTELARILINLAPTPRRLRIAAIDRFELAGRGARIHRGDYQVVELPANTAVEEVEIPRREPGAVHALHFLASVVPHVGIETGNGHFLASYEAVVSYP